MQGFQIQPLVQPLTVSGATGPDEDDRFSGLAIAVGWWPVGPESIPPDPLYLVADPSRPSPVWVASAELLDHTAATGRDF